MLLTTHGSCGQTPARPCGSLNLHANRRHCTAVVARASQPSVNAAVAAAPSSPRQSQAASLAQLAAAGQQRRSSKDVPQPVVAPSQPDHQPKWVHGRSQSWDVPTGLAVTWLGTSSGTPTRERNISCTLVRSQEAMYMVDVGEGSYRQFQMTGMSLAQVDGIFITHMHGDHCFGLGGMLLAMDEAKRHHPNPQQRALRVYGPPGLLQYLHALLVVGGMAQQLHLPVYVTEFEEQQHGHTEANSRMGSIVTSLQPGCHAPLDAAQKVWACRLLPDQAPPPELPAELAEQAAQCGLAPPARESSWRPTGHFQAKPQLSWTIPCLHFNVKAAQMQHRVPCWGYVFEERLTDTPYPQHQESAAASSSSSSSSNNSSSSSSRSRKVVVLGDTMDSCAIIPWAMDADMLAHEATFAQGMEATAWKAQHSTAWMAGQFAKLIRAQMLVLTHFSARYPSPCISRPMANGGRGGQEYRKRPQPEEEMSEWASSANLYKEAAEYYGSKRVLLARDLFTVHVAEAGSEDTAAAAAAAAHSTQEKAATTAPPAGPVLAAAAAVGNAQRQQPRNAGSNHNAAGSRSGSESSNSSSSSTAGRDAVLARLLPAGPGRSGFRGGSSSSGKHPVPSSQPEQETQQQQWRQPRRAS